MSFVKIFLADCRRMPELNDESVDLVITSPPYWQIKDYGIENQVGYGQTLHDYLKDLYLVWKECYRVLRPGSRLCINLGDQFLRAVIYGRYKVAPLHAETIIQCERIGFDYLGSVIWQKKTTMNTTGGETIMGSFPYPPNGLIEIDYEFIMIFKKIGHKSISAVAKERSKLSEQEWKEYFSGHWTFPGASQAEHQAVFPEELPRRLMKMFSCVGDTVLDPFVGSGTTAGVAIRLERNAVGYELNPSFLPLIKNKLEVCQTNPARFEFELQKRKSEEHVDHDRDYTPGVMDAKPIVDSGELKLRVKSRTLL